VSCQVHKMYCHFGELQKMNDGSFYVCFGVGNYSAYKQSIGFQNNNIFQVIAPTDTQSLTCESCTSLKYYLTKQKL
jgi:hypothetical protein